MTITIQQIEDALSEGLSLVSKLAPLAALGGPVAASIGAVVGQIASTGAAVLSAVENDATIIGSGDLTKIRALQAQLQTANAGLAAQVAQD